MHHEVITNHQGYKYVHHLLKHPPASNSYYPSSKELSTRLEIPLDGNLGGHYQHSVLRNHQSLKSRFGMGSQQSLNQPWVPPPHLQPIESTKPLLHSLYPFCCGHRSLLQACNLLSVPHGWKATPLAVTDLDPFCPQ